MYPHSTILVCLAFLTTVGCDAFKSREESGNAWSSGAVRVDGEARTDAGKGIPTINELHAQSPVDVTPATRAELDAFLAKFRSDKNWTYGEAEPGQLAGSWVDVESGGNEIVFDVDGVSGSYAQQFGEDMTAGHYAVSENNRVVCFSKWNGIGLGAHFTLVGDTLTGPRGPNPTAQWKRKFPAP